MEILLPNDRNLASFLPTIQRERMAPNPTALVSIGQIGRTHGGLGLQERDQMG